MNEVSKKIKTIWTIGLTKDLIDKFSILNGAKYFSLEIFWNYLVLLPTKKYIKYFSPTTRVESWKYNAATFVYHHLLPDLNFNGHCLIKNISIPKK